MKKSFKQIIILFSISTVILSCSNNNQVHEEMLEKIFSRSYTASGGNKSGINSGPTNMTIEKYKDGKIKVNVENQTGNVYSGYTTWNDSYLMDFSNVFKINKDNKFGFGGKIKKSEQGTTDITFNISWIVGNDGDEYLSLQFFNDYWSQWNRFEFEEASSVQNEFRKIVDNVKFDN